jgi:hypothetical protein
MWLRTVIALVALIFGLAALKFVPGIHLPGKIWDLWSIPPIAEGLPWSFPDRAAYLDQRLRATFPPGTRVSEVIEELERQGFVIDEGSREARYSWVGLGCFCQLLAEWRPINKESPLVSTTGYFFYPFSLSDSTLRFLLDVL